MRSLCARFAGDRRGNFGVVTAVIVVPVLMAAGLSVDIATIEKTRTDLQQAMDSAALAIAREGKDIPGDEAEAIARQFLAGNFAADYTKLGLAREGTAITVKADTLAKLNFASLFGFDTWPVEAASTADIAYASYEIGLVLDTTGSMAGGKLASMKDAVLGLIDGMTAEQDDPDRLKFALVPFATFVNVGPQFAPSFDDKGKLVKGSGAKWLDLKGDSPIPELELQPGVSRFEAMNNLHEKWAGCVETRPATKKGNYDVEDLPPNPKDPASLFVPAFNIDEPDTGGYANSYIQSSVNPLDQSGKGKKKKLQKYGVEVGGLISLAGSVLNSLLWGPPQGAVDMSGGKGPNYSCTSQPITALTADYGDLKDKVESLEAKGTTNIMEGVMWGWRVLSPGAPFTEGKDPADDPNLHKIMIVLTDGSNNLGVNNTALGSDYSSEGYLVDGRLGITSGSNATATSRMNDKTLTACTNAKKDGIEIYTIRLEEPDVKTGMMLKDCASDAAHFFDAPSRGDLNGIFQNIKTKITQVRLAS